jgi:methylsterol monooxygenase
MTESSSDSQGNKKVLTGFSPRVYPRPEYISLAANLKMMAKEILFQSGFLGTCYTLLLFPLYQTVMTNLRENLDPETSEKILFTIAFNSSHLVAYIFWNSLFGCFDYFGLMQQFKLARKSFMQPNKALIVQTLVQAAVSQLIINPLLSYYMLYDVFKSFGMSASDAPLPSILEMFKVYCMANIFNSFFFYWAHRIFHSSLLYATFHKQHHEYRGTMGISAEHAGKT